MISRQKYPQKQETCDGNDPRLNPTTNLRDPRASCKERRGFTWNTIPGENVFIGRLAHGKKSRIPVQAEDIGENSSSKTILKQFQKNQRQHPRGLCPAPAGHRGFEMETTQKFLKYSPPPQKKDIFAFAPALVLIFQARGGMLLNFMESDSGTLWKWP